MASPVKKNLELGLCGHQPKTAMGFQSPIHYEGSLEWTNNLLEPCRGTHCLTPQFLPHHITVPNSWSSHLVWGNLQPQKTSTITQNKGLK